MILNVRGRKFKVHGDGAALRRMYERQYANMSNARLDRFEAEDFPDRGILRDALNAVYRAEELLRALMMDELEVAEEEAAKGPDFVPDFVTEDGDECLYTENVNPELDAAIYQLFETGLTLRGMLDES